MRVCSIIGIPKSIHIGLQSGPNPRGQEPGQQQQFSCYQPIKSQCLPFFKQIKRHCLQHPLVHKELFDTMHEFACSMWVLSYNHLFQIDMYFNSMVECFWVKLPYPLYNEVFGVGDILVSLHLSIRLSRIPCLLCSTYTSGWILFILGTNVHKHERGCRKQQPFTLTYIFKVIQP